MAQQPGRDSLGDRSRLELPYEATTDLLEFLVRLQVIKAYDTEMVLTVKGDFIVTGIKVIL